MGFFSKWKSEAEKIKTIQTELAEILAHRGINFMQLHPEVHKSLIHVAKNKDSATSVESFDKIINAITAKNPDITFEQLKQRLIETATITNKMTR